MNQANWDDILGKAKEFGKAVGNVAGEVVDACLLYTSPSPRDES